MKSGVPVLLCGLIHFSGFRSFCFFVVFLFGIDAPDIGLVLCTGKDILYRFKGGYHGMINIIIAMLSVAAYAV